VGFAPYFNRGRSTTIAKAARTTPKRPCLRPINRAVQKMFNQEKTHARLPLSTMRRWLSGRTETAVRPSQHCGPAELALRSGRVSKVLVLRCG